VRRGGDRGAAAAEGEGGVMKGHPPLAPPSALVLIALAPLLFGFKPFEKRNAEVEQGNAAMQAGKAEEALGHYDKAVAKLPADPGVHLDRGAALYALSRFEEAGKEFLRATEGQDPALKATAFRNLGNALSKQEKQKEAIEAYKRALALRPDDKAAKWNLEIALKKKKEEEKKQQDDKDKNKDDKKDDKDKQDKQDKQDDKDKKDDKDKQDKKDDKDKDKDKDANKDQNKDKKDQDKQEKQPQPEKAAENQPERIQEMLKNLEASPKNLERERARLRAIRRGPVSRDW
jgi:tetratricopeptide (TPR) repeat protein